MTSKAEFYATKGQFIGEGLGVGLELNDSKDRVSAPLGHMPSEYGSVLGERVAARGSGRQVWCYTVRTNSAAAVAVGVADASVPLTAKSGPATVGWHIGKGKPIKTKDGKKLSTSGMMTNRTDRPARGKDFGTAELKVLAIVDMNTRHIAISVDGSLPMDLGVTIPSSVRPWVFLDGPGVGSVELTEHYKEDPAAMEASAKIPTVPITADALSAARDGVSSTQPDATGNEHEGAPRATDTSFVETSASTSRSVSSTGNEPEPIAWTFRAASWLSPLQEALGFTPEKPKNIETATPELSA